MNTLDNSNEPTTKTSWAASTLAPALAITADWWNQAARLDPIPEESFTTWVPEDGALADASGPITRAGHCPACGSIIYSRRHRLCGVCAHPLPSDALFSESESSRIQLVVAIERGRHRQWLVRVLS
jgi:hypothetical protein